MFGKGQRVVGIEVSLVQRRAKGFLQYARVKPPAPIGGERMGEFGYQRRTVRAGRSENVRMPHAKMQCAIASHGNSANPMGLAIGHRTILAVNRWNQFLNEAILVALLAVK